VMTGLCSGLLKSFVPQKGKLKHEHGTTKTSVDSQIPKPSEVKGSVQDLHRQIGPGHDALRFKEAVKLMSGESSDYKLWGGMASSLTGGTLHPGNMKIDNFIKSGGFRVPSDPMSELINHLVIDFFTKRSLPIPGSTYIADKNEKMAKLMLTMYDEGFNLKNVVASSSATFILELITNSYVFIMKGYKSDPSIIETEDKVQFASKLKHIIREYKDYKKSKEFSAIEIIAHGTSVLVDAMILVGAKSYAGLYSLNFTSIMVFVRHLWKYLKSSFEEQKSIAGNISNIKDTILSKEDEWSKLISEDIERLIKNKNFLATFSIKELAKKEEDSEHMLSLVKEKVESSKKSILSLRELKL